MTAQQIIDLTKPILSNMSIKSDDATLLGFLNLAKNEIALDTRLWLDGEEITMTTANEYTLTAVPIQILDVYDGNLMVRPKNSTDFYGYYKTGPDTIRINNPVSGLKLYVNYYYTPDDYILTDTVVVPNSLVKAMQHFIAHMAHDTFKSQNEMIGSNNHYSKYEKAIAKYLSKVDENTDSILDDDMIEKKGLV